LANYLLSLSLSLLFLSFFLSLPPKKREKWATPITQKHTYKEEEGVMSSTLKKKTPINTNIQRRRRSDEHHFATKNKQKNTHKHKTYKEEEEVMSTTLPKKVLKQQTQNKHKSP
jgi:hypothetical protein